MRAGQRRWEDPPEEWEIDDPEDNETVTGATCQICDNPADECECPGGVADVRIPKHKFNR